MPDSYTFCGTLAANFSESRDAEGTVVGYVKPGDEREFDAPADTQPPEDMDEAARFWWAPAPTADWFPSDGPLPKRLPDPEPEDEGQDGGVDGAEKPPALPAPSTPAPAIATRPVASTTPPVTSPEPLSHEV